MGKVLLCLAVVFLACYASDGAEIGGKASRLGQYNAYYVYARDYASNPKRIYATLPSANLDARDFRSKVVVLVHDHGESHYSSFNDLVITGLLTDEDVTVIVVDWSIVAGLSYTSALAQAPSVSANIAELIRVLLVYRRVTLANLHIVGFGLGAHVAAFASRSINGVVARITGLDPSRLQGTLTHEYLKPTDAAYVEVIHTDGNGIGMGTPIGNADFFPNGGINQPGCFEVDDNDEVTTVDNACNHRRAYELFAASLLGESLTGKRCTSNIVSSENCNGYSLLLGTNILTKVGSGSFYLETDIQLGRFQQLRYFQPKTAEAI